MDFYKAFVLQKRFYKAVKGRAEVLTVEAGTVRQIEVADMGQQFHIDNFPGRYGDDALRCFQGKNILPVLFAADSRLIQRLKEAAAFQGFADVLKGVEAEGVGVV